MTTENNVAEGNGLDVKDVLSNPDVQNEIQKIVEEQVKGLKNKNQELLAKNKEFAEMTKQWEGVDPNIIKNLVDRMRNDEETKLLAEGKIDDVVNRRVENMKKDHTSQLEALSNKLKDYENEIKQRDHYLTELVIDHQIKDAYTSLDFEPAALDDIVRYARTIFKMDENRNAVPRDPATGSLIFGKDGKTPISAREWLENLAEKKPYLKRPSKGGGSQGGRSGQGTKNVDSMSSVEKIAHGLRKEGMYRD